MLETSEENLSRKTSKKMVQALKETGVFEVISGLLVGKPMDEAFYDDYKEALLDIIDSNIPIVYNLNVGHATQEPLCPLASMLMWMQKSKSFVLTITKINNFSILCFGIDFRYNLCLNLLHFAYFYDIFLKEVYMTKQKINQIVGSIGAFIGIIVFIAYIPQILPIYKATRLNHFSLYPQQYLV